MNRDGKTSLRMMLEDLNLTKLINDINIISLLKALENYEVNKSMELYVLNDEGFVVTSGLLIIDTKNIIKNLIDKGLDKCKVKATKRDFDLLKIYLLKEEK